MPQKNLLKKLKDWVQSFEVEVGWFYDFKPNKQIKPRKTWGIKLKKKW